MCCVLLFLGCSDTEEDTPALEKGSFQVQVFLDNEPYENAMVTTKPTTSSLLTDSDGSAFFDNIVVGEYEVQVVIPEAPEDYFISFITVIKDDTAYTRLDLVSPPPIYPDEIDVTLVLASVYESVGQSYNFDGFSTLWGDIGTDFTYVNKQTNGERTALDTYRLSSQDRLVNQVYKDYYAIILDINTGLECLKDPECLGTQEIDTTRLEAEFKFLRALTYFNLVKIYGNPILVTTVNSDIETPLPIVQGGEEVYQQIIEDLMFAKQYLPNIESVFMASKEAATALLGKVYMQMAGFPLLQTGKYSLALEQFKKLQNWFSLEENYSEVFSLDQGSQSTENILMFKFTSGLYGRNWGPLGFAGDDLLLLDRSFITASGAGETFTDSVTFPINVPDVRFHQNIASFRIASGQIENETDPNSWRPLKFMAKDNLLESKNINQVVLIRYADVLLLLAEAENNVNGPTALAYEAFNSVRRRAHQNGDFDLPLGLNQQEFFDAIVEERKLELCFEGHRKDDLVRWQLLENKLLEFNEQHPQDVKDFQSHKYIWPIPQNELDVNPEVQQNPGY